jgi:hypothetical protein
VLAGDVGVDVLDGHPAVVGHQQPQPRAVQDRARPEHPPRRQPRVPEGGVGDHVDRVGDQQQDGLGGDLEQLGDQVAAQGHVGLGQLQAGLARLLLGPGRHHHQVGVPADLDVVGADHGGLGDELEPVLQVQHLGPGLVGVDVVDGDGPADPPDQAGIGGGRPDAPGTDDGDPGGGGGPVHGRMLPGPPGEKRRPAG